MDFKINRLASGGIITNYYCTSACRHCLYRCSPRWEKKYLDSQTAELLLQCIRRLGCSSIHIGGGEPMLRPYELGKLLEIATNLGMSIGYVETNSSWFKDMDSALSILAELKRHGLTTLLVSISPFHNEFIPFAKTKGVMAACRQSHVNIFPWTSDFIRDLSEFRPAITHPLEEYTGRFGREYLQEVLQRYWIHMGGRALELFRPVISPKSVGQILKENPDNCARELTDTSHFHFDLFGNYIPGLCSGLSIYYEDLGKPLPPERYPILTTLFQSGISGLLEHTRSEFGFTSARAGYINKCDLCTEIRTFLVRHNFSNGSELSPKEFYQKV